jgi:hypothetical protein
VSAPVIRKETWEDCSLDVVVTVHVSPPAATFQNTAPVATPLVASACPSFVHPVAEHVGEPSVENTTSSRSPAEIPDGSVIEWLVVLDAGVAPVARAATTGAATDYASDSVTVRVQVEPDAFVPSDSTLRFSIRPVAAVALLNTPHSCQAKFASVDPNAER